MISLLEKSKEIIYPKKEGYIEAKIRAVYLSYGNKYPFLSFWQGKNSGKITSIICKFEDNVFLSASNNANYDELKEFLSVIGFSSLQAEEKVLKNLKYLHFKKYSVLKNENNAAPIITDDIIENPPLKEVYSILFKEKNNNITPIPFEGWYVDISHRIRHGTAKTVICNNSAAVISHITENSALLGGIATLSVSRNNGYASRLINYLKNEYKGKNLFAATDENTENFYIKNGFKIVEKIGILISGVQ